MQRLVGLGVAVTLLFVGSPGRAEVAVAVPSSPTPYPALGAEQPAGPFVYLRAENPRTTLQVQLDPELWRDVCIVPCARSLDPSRTYRITGRRFVPTDPFTLPKTGGQVTIDAKMGSRVEKTAGKVMVPVGAALAITGVVFFFVEPRKSDSESVFEQNQRRSTYHSYGALGMVGGLALSLAGLLFWHRSSSTVEMN